MRMETYCTFEKYGLYNICFNGPVIQISPGTCSLGVDASTWNLSGLPTYRNRGCVNNAMQLKFPESLGTVGLVEVSFRSYGTARGPERLGKLGLGLLFQQ